MSNGISNYYFETTNQKSMLINPPLLAKRHAEKIPSGLINVFYGGLGIIFRGAPLSKKNIEENLKLLAKAKEGENNLYSNMENKQEGYDFMKKKLDNMVENGHEYLHIYDLSKKKRDIVSSQVSYIINKLNNNNKRTNNFTDIFKQKESNKYIHRNNIGNIYSSHTARYIGGPRKRSSVRYIGRNRLN